MTHAETTRALTDALAIIRDLHQSYGWDQLHITGPALVDWFTDCATEIEPDAARRADEWSCDLLEVGQ